MADHSNAAPVLLARHAMRCRFELVLHGDNPVRLRAAGEEALDEIDRLEGALSLYRSTSEIAAVNRRAAEEPVRVSPETFQLLQRAAGLSRATQGAFDITIAPLMRAWGFLGGDGHPADPPQLAAALECVGMHRVELDPAELTVRFQRPGMMIDLGAIGKGFAVDRAAEVLREAGVASALIHGGTSTVFAIGRPPDLQAWKIAVEAPAHTAQTSPALLATIELCNESLSTSAISGKAFTSEGRMFGHVIDPRSGHPVQAALLASLVAPSAAESDALSTALLTLGIPGLLMLEESTPDLRALVVAAAAHDGPLRVASRGISLRPEFAAAPVQELNSPPAS